MADLQVPGALTVLLLLCFPVVQATNVTSYLSKYQIQPGIEGMKAPFRCHNNGRIVQGRADFSAFPTEEDGSPLSFLQESNRQGFHCVCPEGFTGLRCGRPYEFCGSKFSSNNNRSNGNGGINSKHTSLHVCFNHGKCIDGLEAVLPVDQQYCDCIEATFRGKTYSGKYCEKAMLGVQTCDSEGSQFCIHGECKTEVVGNSTSHNCHCDSGWAGEHCDFLRDEKPACDLDCGPGECRITFAQYDDPTDYHQYWQHNVNHTFCSCPPGRTGTTCEISEEALAAGSGSTDVCDESLQYFCVNGGICKSDYLQSLERPCSCPVGRDGPHCEFKEGEVPDCTMECENSGICTLGIQTIHDANNYSLYWEQTVNKMYCSCRDGFHGVHCEVDLTTLHSSQCGQPPNDLFCFNGVCEVDRTSGQPVCHCKRGFAGEACQYRQNEVPDCKLDCVQGTCILGVKALADDKDINRFWETHVNFTYCHCDPGWYGMNCEIPSIQCGSKTCLGNGTKCAAEEDGQGFCDCSSGTTSSDPLALAGENCQYAATSICNTTTESYFCYNNGRCSTTKAGCDCIDGFTGPVCEYEPGKELDCTLECHNEGICKKGNKYISNFTQTPELDFLQVFSNDHFGSENCLCKDGFSGVMCETEVEVCGDDNHLCLHGSQCLEEQDGSYRCDCESAFTPSSRYAGKFCQHHHTDICAPSEQLLFDGSAADMSFCVNDGVCRAAGTPGYPGCDCGPLYFGSRCEFSRLFADDLPRQSDEEATSHLGILVYIFFLFIFFCIAVLVGWRIRQNSKEIAESESDRWSDEDVAPIAVMIPTDTTCCEANTESAQHEPLASKAPDPKSRLENVEIL